MKDIILAAVNSDWLPMICLTIFGCLVAVMVTIYNIVLICK